MKLKPGQITIAAVQHPGLHKIYYAVYIIKLLNFKRSDVWDIEVINTVNSKHAPQHGKVIGMHESHILTPTLKNKKHVLRNVFYMV